MKNLNFTNWMENLI